MRCLNLTHDLGVSGPLAGARACAGRECGKANMKAMRRLAVTISFVLLSGLGMSGSFAGSPTGLYVALGCPSCGSLVGRLVMDAGRREGRLDQFTRRGEPTASLLSCVHRRRRMERRGGDRPHRPSDLPLWRHPALFRMPGCGEWQHVRAASSEAVRPWKVLPVPALLWTRLCEPERG